MAPVTRAAPRKLRMNPARDICGTVTQPLPNTMALGGVATGIMNANDAEQNPKSFHDAPYLPKVSRPDEARAARKPVLRWHAKG
jgi:hypothetical protein